jgi:hypothetical protein
MDHALGYNGHLSSANAYSLTLSSHFYHPLLNKEELITPFMLVPVGFIEAQ